MQERKAVKRKGILILFVYICSVGACNQAVEPKWEEAITVHSIETDDSRILSEVWRRTAFTPDELESIQLGSNSGFVLFMGSLDKFAGDDLIVLESHSGDIAWIGPRVDAMDVTADVAYVGDGESIVALSLFNGQKLWSRNLPGSRGISYLYSFDKVLQAFSFTSEFLILDKSTGEVLDRSQSRDIFSQAPHWVLEREAVFEADLVFYKDAYSQERATPIIAAYQETIDFNLTGSGEILWETEPRIISNVAVSEKYAFMIHALDALIIRDKVTGKVVESLSISPSINFYDPQINPQGEGYHLAVDRQRRILFVLLGDSNQLFAFAINE